MEETDVKVLYFLSKFEITRWKQKWQHKILCSHQLLDTNFA